MQTRPWQKMVSGCVLREAVYELVTGTIRLLYDLVQVRYETTRRYSLFTYLLQRINRKIVRKSCIALGRSKHAADFSFLSLSLSLSGADWVQTVCSCGRSGPGLWASGLFFSSIIQQLMLLIGTILPSVFLQKTAINICIISSAWSMSLN